MIVGNRKSEALSIRLLGRFDVSRGSDDLRGLHRRAGEHILAYLVLNPGQPVSYRRLAELFWPSEAGAGHESDAGGYPNTRQAIRSLRLALGEDAWRIGSRGKGTVVIDLTDADVDVEEFDRLALSEDPEDWACGLKVYRGPLLFGWSDCWAQEPRLRRRRSFERMAGSLMDHLLKAGRLEEADAVVRRAIEATLGSERWWRELLRIYALQGMYEQMETAGDQIRADRERRNRRPDSETDQLLARLREEAEAALRARRTMPSYAAVSVCGPSPALPPITRSRPPAGFDLEPVGGAMPLDSPFYVVRSADAELHDAIERRDSIVLIQGPRQMGKTSLLARGMHRARQSGMRVVRINLEKLNAEQLASPDSFLFALASATAIQLGISIPEAGTWDPRLGANMNMEMFMTETVLKKIDGELLWALDEVDRLFTCPFGSDVFGLFRSWHNERSLEPSGPFARLTIAIAHAAEPHLFVSDPNRSSFNVGTQLTLSDFTLEQAADLNARYGRPLKVQEDIARFHRITAGHPYLTRRGLDHLVRAGMGLDALEAQSDSDDGPFGDHLRRILTSILPDPELVASLRQILTEERCVSAASFYRLRSLGVIRGALGLPPRLRCEVYRAYLCRHLPD